MRTRAPARLDRSDCRFSQGDTWPCHSSIYTNMKRLPTSRHVPLSYSLSQRHFSKALFLSFVLCPTAQCFAYNPPSVHPSLLSSIPRHPSQRRRESLDFYCYLVTLHRTNTCHDPKIPYFTHIHSHFNYNPTTKRHTEEQPTNVYYTAWLAWLSMEPSVLLWPEESSPVHLRNEAIFTRHASTSTSQMHA